MTFFDTLPIDTSQIIDTDSPAPLAFPAGADVIDTSAIRRLVPVLVGQLIAMFTLTGIKRGARTRLLTIKRMLVRLHKAECANYAVWLRQALRADPLWQYRVHEDLGGLRALRRWDLRSARMMDPAPEVRANGKVAGHAPSLKRGQQKPCQPRGDRDGLFRLATLSRSDGSRPPGITAPRVSVPLAMAVIEQPRPVPLVPDDLRHSCGVESAGSNAPCVRAVTIHRLWDNIHGQHMDWNTTLLMADMAFMRGDWRREFVVEYAGNTDPP